MRGRRISIARTSFFLIFSCLGILVSVFPPFSVCADSPAPSGSRMILSDGWKLESACNVKATGEQISRIGFRTDGWHETRVPSTVVAALVADHTYPDPFFGMNLRSLPGTTYPIGANFSLLDMPKDSPFRCSWWYRTEFRPPAGFEGRRDWLHFSGINNRANIWVNGHRVADALEIAGAFRAYDFDVTPLLVHEESNVLAIETIAQTPSDLGINWADWNPAPPDKDMGLWREVYLQATGPVALRYPEVITHFPDASLQEADLTVIAELHNATKTKVAGRVDGQIEEVRFHLPVVLLPGETRTVRFTPDQFPQLRLRNPKLWWPAPLGPQNLHSLSLGFMAGDEVSDAQTVRFGIREVTSELDERGYRQFRVNEKRILIRGAGWAPDMLLRESRERLVAEFRYVREMNLNTLRLEGKLESDDFYDLADEQGILILAGWSCCDRWEEWGKWKPTDLTIAAESLRSQILRMRRHPSMLAWLNGSDNPPPANVERAYIKVLKDSDWPNPYLSSASGKPSTVTGPTGVKMSGPYDYVPPDYWLNDPGKYGGAYGFNTETSPGPAIPLVESLRKFLPADHLWPSRDFWSYHAASDKFQNTSRFDKALDASYGAPEGLEEYVTKSQAMAYDAERAMFEAYTRNKYTSTGVIQWMLNNAWPSLYWHLFDYYLQPAGGYFGTKKACESLHVQYSYDDRSVVVVNQLYRQFSGLIVTAELFDLNLEKKFSQQAFVDIEPDAVRRVLTIPPTVSGPSSPIYFVKLALEDAAGHRLSSNFYWLSSKPAKIEYAKTIYFGDPKPPVNTSIETSIYTPASPYDDFTALRQLPGVRLIATASIESEGGGARLVRVKLQNPSPHLAFQVRLAVRRKSDEMEILPVFWEDNYVELMPGESREITARYLDPDALGANPMLTVVGWNIEPARILLEETKENPPPPVGHSR